MKTKEIAKDTTEANARLITAAPELLEACIDAAYRLARVTRICNDSKNIGEIERVVNGWHKIIESAIAKAEGR